MTIGFINLELGNKSYLLTLLMTIGFVNLELGNKALLILSWVISSCYLPVIQTDLALNKNFQQQNWRSETKI